MPVAYSKGGKNYHCVLSQNGAPTLTLDDCGTPVWLRDADVFGNTRFSSGSVSECPLGFLGQYRDNESGQYYNYHRYYDPEVARFITQDPIGLSGGLNFYRYTTNPLTWIDPFGLFEISVSARCDWNEAQMEAFKKKVARYNQAIADEKENGNDGIVIAPCARQSKNLREEYKKCGSKDGAPKNDSPKDKGKPVDCKDDIDHIIECQMGGAQSGQDLCDNLTPVNASVNRSLGSQLRTQLKGKASQVLELVKIGQRDCSSNEPRTPACS